jgi:hypothetical protein
MSCWEPDRGGNLLQAPIVAVRDILFYPETDAGGAGGNQ